MIFFKNSFQIVDETLCHVKKARILDKNFVEEDLVAHLVL